MPSRLLAIVLTLCVVVAARAQCIPHFLPGYDYGTLTSNSPGAFDSIYSAAVFDDHSGTGPALFIGGHLSVIGDHPGSWMAKLVGDHWEAIPGFDSSPRCMAVFDDGSGPALYVGGSFNTFPGGTGCMAKWNGSTWTGLGLVRGGSSPMGVWALTRHDDGTGPALYAGGVGFGITGQINNSLVMKYSGGSWHSLDNGGWLGGPNYGPMTLMTMVSFDNGGGPRLYVGGSFNTIPGGPTGAVNGVAVWDGTSWSAGASGIGQTAIITSLVVHQNTLFAAGDTPAGPVAVWRLNGTAWEASYGVNADFHTSIGGTALLSYDDGTGPALYAMVGLDSHSGGELAVYSNGVWTTYGPSFTNDVGFSHPFMSVLLPAPTAFGTRVVAVGRCTAFGSTPIPNVGVWNQGAWEPIEHVGFGSIGGGASLLYDPEDDNGVVYAAGKSYGAAGPGPLGIPVSSLRGLVRLHSPGVSTLVACDINRLMTNSGQGWQVGVTLPGSVVLGGSTALGVAQDTSPESLVLGTSTQVYRLVGTAWVPLGSPFHSLGTLRPYVECSGNYDSGSGTKLYVGGGLNTVGSVTSCYLAYFDNGDWQPVEGVIGSVTDMKVFDTGTGPELVVACGAGANGGVMRWNGSRLQDITGNLGAAVHVTALLPFDDGTGLHLWAACNGSSIGDLAYWNGTQWQSYPGLQVDTHNIGSLAPARRSDGTHSLMVAGTFASADGLLATNIAELATCRRTCDSDFNGDGDVGTDADIGDFFACLAGSCCATCGSADFNNDGDVGTDADIEAFFRVLAGGSC